MTTDDTTDWKAAYFALAEVCKTETGWLREHWADMDAERARHAALVAAARDLIDWYAEGDIRVFPTDELDALRAALGDEPQNPEPKPPLRPRPRTEYVE